MFIKQISVFLENTTGALCEVAQMLGRGGINIMAISLADTQNFGIVRMIVAEPQVDRAVSLLRGAAYTCRVNSVICVVVEDQPNGLGELLGIIEEAKLSVEYMYSFFHSTGNNALIILRMSDQERAVQCLLDGGVRIMTQQEVDAL